MENSPTAQALFDLLRDERRALKTAAFDRLEALSQRKGELLGQLRHNGATASETERLRAEAKRNAALLSALRSGIAAARARLTEVRDGPGQFCTYGRHGERQQLGVAPSTSIKRS